MSEQVLGFRREDLPVEWLGNEVALPLEDGVLDDFTPLWCKREDAEADENYKQIIPYAIVRCRHDGLLACYPRKGAESRLHGKWSLGVGGHINPEDDQNGASRTALAALRRELAEEFDGIDIGRAEIALVGVINEEHSAVGRVHLGIVYLVTVQSKPEPADELAGLRWVRESQLAEYNLELWSRLALRCVEIQVEKGEE